MGVTKMTSSPDGFRFGRHKNGAFYTRVFVLRGGAFLVWETAKEKKRIIHRVTFTLPGQEMPRPLVITRAYKLAAAVVRGVLDLQNPLDELSPLMLAWLHAVDFENTCYYDGVPCGTVEECWLEYLPDGWVAKVRPFITTREDASC
jgi:hypothetical protein